MSYIFLPDLAASAELPAHGILSNVLHKDAASNITLFGFSAGQELSSHSAPTPAILYFLEGSASVQLGEDVVRAGAGSFVYMPPMLPHGIQAETAVRMLLIQIKQQETGTAGNAGQ